VRDYLTGNPQLSLNAPASGDANVTEVPSLIQAVERVNPDIVLNFAGISNTQLDSKQLFEVNGFGQKHVIEALMQCGFSGHLIYLSSSAIYGNRREVPLTENTQPLPNSNYALSKLLGEYFASTMGSDFKITNVRPFNIIGLRQKVSFLVPKIAAAFRQRRAEILLGNLEVRRDFVDVRDFARMIECIIACDQHYPLINACNGDDQSIGDIVQIFENITGHHPNVSQDPALMRNTDIFFQRGDASIIKKLGYQRIFSLEETLSGMLLAANT